MSVRKNTLDGLFSGIEDITDAKGRLLNTVLYNRAGNYSSIFEIENPVQQYCTDADQYYAFMNVLDHILQTLGEGYALQKQDIFCRQKFHHDITPGMEFLTESYFRYYEGRPYTEIRTFIVITQETRKSTFVAYDPKKWAKFNNKIQKVKDILEEKGLPHHLLNRQEIDEYLHRFMAFDFKKGPFGMTNLKCTDDSLKMGDRVIKSFSLVDIDVIDLPTVIHPIQTKPVNGYPVSTDLLSFLSTVPLVDCVVYNQVIQIPAQRRERQRLIGKSKRHASMPDPSNKIAKADIDEVLEVIATQQKTMVWTNFNILVSCQQKDLTKVTSYLETKLFEVGIAPSKSAYNQLELFTCSFPGNAYCFNKDYDLFLTLQDSALCLFYKERMKHDEVTPLKVYYTDRQGVPVSIDFTGKEGELKLTNNSNFFCLGPSGSGKSFSTNTVVRQLIEQDTDVVMVDTGDSYEGICGYFHGTYISYSKEHPISMNPFKVSDVEYQQNFGEKKNFLKSLIFQIFKGNKAPEKLEDTIIDTVLNEYYDAYFHPFTGYTNEEKDELRKQLLLADKRNGKYGEYIEEIEKDTDVVSGLTPDPSPNGEGSKETYSEDEKAHHAKVQRIVEKLHNLANDEGASAGERAHANNQLMRLMPELIEGHYLMKIDQRIARMERQKRDLKVTRLSFDTFYEYACERIPQMMEEKSIAFPINEFAAILEPFHKGGKMDTILNNDMDLNLFDEKFIVFEIDKIKDDPVLFPIVVLIIMDVFLQKMRIKKGRKALIIEEAWKAISSPTMAEYIKYLYKTVRKFHGIAGVVTQELGDVIDSPIVKEAIINNSDIKILLDQSKFKDRYDEIAAILGITDVQRQQIFTINSLDNHDGRNYFKEVWICRGQSSDVYGVEEPPECYMAYTTERAEKEALKIYIKYYGGDTVEGIRHFCQDMEKAGLSGKYLKFANEVNKQQNIMPLWDLSTPSNGARRKPVAIMTVLLFVLLMVTTPANAYWRWNFDWKTVIQVGANTTAAAGVEGAHNATLDEQRKKQERIAEYTTAIHVIRELYKMSMQNTGGFGQESRYYQLIGENALYIVTNIPVAISWLSKNPAINLPLCLNEISNLTMKTEQCIAGFVNIVNNGHVKSPLKDNPLIPGGGGRANIGKDDGYNFMSRADRMGMANDILEDLVIVRNNLDYIIFMCQTNNGLEDLLMELDPDTWCTAMQFKWSVEDVVRGWEDFS